MNKKTVQISYDKKLKKPIFEELTYEFFAEHLDWEWFFTYKDKSINIAWHKDGDKVIYELNIKNYDKNVMCYEFDTPKDLLENGKIDDKTIKEIWIDLKF